MTQRIHSVGVIGGDGIGPEVTDAALEVVRAAGVSFTIENFDLGAALPTRRFHPR
jgi:3-isopropylmalate dehydrogenase